ncbi:oxidoreductase [Salinicola aestuarinus]|uniref:oxidoreductase n=1 Tax=Salinicola aestuarinus TaxID=1949082 RepID=UPI000DA15371|nr:oxidoreductase [Salinicola aestuarinus]
MSDASSHLSRAPLAVVTGATAGLGFETAKGLVEAGYRVILAARSPEKGEIACQSIRQHHADADVHFALLNLDSLSSVRAFAEALRREESSLDRLINNAGIMALPQRELTEDGIERQFGVNFLSHFLLTSLLMPLLEAADAPRVVQLSSLAHRSASIHFDDLDGGRHYGAWRAYRQSKLAMLLFAQALARRSDANGWNVLSVAAHPGLSRTALFDTGVKSRALMGKAFKLVMPLISQTAAAGARPTLHAALSDEAESGDYFGPDGFSETTGKPRRAHRSKAAQDRAVEDRLWDVACELTGAVWPTP